MEILRRLIFWFENRQGYLKLNRYCSDNSSFYSVLMYHGVENNEQKQKLRLYDMSEKAIKKEINFYLSQGYKLHSCIDVDDNKNLPRSSLMLSFDDGYRNIAQTIRSLSRQYQVRPILAICPGVIEGENPYWYEEIQARLILSKHLNIHPACQNVDDSLVAYRQIMTYYFSDVSIKSKDLLSDIREATSDVDMDQISSHQAVHQTLTWDELCSLIDQNCCIIAAHTMHHESVTHMTRQEFEDDIDQSKRLIQKNLNVDCQHFVYPFGNYANDWETEVLSDSAMNFSYAVDNKINIDPKNNYRIKRITGKDLSKELGYYRYLWHQRHAQLITLK